MLLFVASVPAVVGFQAAMRVGAMKPAMAARAPSTAMLVDPAMLDTSAIVEAPTQLLALKSEADEVIGEFCSARIKLIPASEGTGIIAGTSVRAVAEMAGIKNLLSKSMGSTNPINLVKATLDALAQLRTPEQVEELRSTKL